jgi:hypothetical protein
MVTRRLNTINFVDPALFASPNDSFGEAKSAGFDTSMNHMGVHEFLTQTSLSYPVAYHDCSGLPELSFPALLARRALNPAPGK